MGETDRQAKCLWYLVVAVPEVACLKNLGTRLTNTYQYHPIPSIHRPHSGILPGQRGGIFGMEPVLQLLTTFVCWETQPVGSQILGDWSEYPRPSSLENASMSAIWKHYIYICRYMSCACIYIYMYMSCICVCICICVFTENDLDPWVSGSLACWMPVQCHFCWFQH